MHLYATEPKDILYVQNLVIDSLHFKFSWLLKASRLSMTLLFNASCLLRTFSSYTFFHGLSV